jgi:hypothetical protein
VNTDELIKMVHANFSRIYLGGIPSLLNDSGGAFLSFICTLTGTEALGGFLKPNEKNGPRFKSLVKDYFPAPLDAQSETLWQFRNAAVHGFSPGPYKVTHHNSHLHLTTDDGLTVLNAEDFYAALVAAAKKYFDAVQSDPVLRAAFEERAKDPDTGVLLVGPLKGRPYR